MEVPEYIVEDAAAVVMKTISAELQSKFSFEDIVEILETEFEFLQLSGIAGEQSPIIHIPIEVPAKLDEAAMEYFIISRCAKKHIFLTFEELQEILDAEMVYLEQQGLLDEDGAGQYLN